MKCREAMEKRGVTILEVHPKGVEFICRSERVPSRTSTVLERLDFWDYTSPLSLFKLRSPWWKGEYDLEDEEIYLVMGDPDQEV